MSWLSIPEAAEKLNKPQTTIRRMIRAGMMQANLAYNQNGDTVIKVKIDDTVTNNVSAGDTIS